MQSKTTKSKTRKSSTKSKGQRRGAHKSSLSASDTVKGVAEACNVNYRKARRVARQLGLGVGKGSTYNTLNKTQVKKLTKALS